MSSIGDPDLLVVASIKAVALTSTVDPLTGGVTVDPMSVGASIADLAALEWALRCGDAWGCPVLAVSAGGPTADVVLRDGLAAGASEAVRVDLKGGDLPSSQVAAGLGRVLATRAGIAGCIVFCGDASVDRGSGSVPAFLAAELGVAQALGLVALDIGPDHLVVQRRLDRGRREILQVTGPAVLSVEGGSARLRRAPLHRAIEYSKAEIMSVKVATVSGPAVELVDVEPYRPRASVVPPPAGAGVRERIMVLTGAAREQPASRALELGPEAAADELLATLRLWGEIS